MSRFLAWLQGLPAWATGLLAVVFAGIVVAGGIAGYQTYDYVEHDNEFCLSCHLMAEPFEEFARSAHRDLGCKACHTPNFQTRSTMALTQIIENPDTLTAHAEVPNEKCASCHIEGDPETWETIRNSAGHRIHFESQDTALQGLKCVECHSSGIHEFTAVDETCAQSGCHTDSDIQLGGMGDLTIHCQACHGFSTPVDPAEPAEALTEAVSPDAAECMSCHAMRTLTEMPPDEPHQQACGSCHNPHEQATPEEAVETCATAGCHTDAAEVSPMHRGLDPGVLEGCTTCHEAHAWDIEGETCLSCHQDVFEEGSGSGRASLPEGHPDLPAGHPRPASTGSPFLHRDMGPAADGAVRVAALGSSGLIHSTPPPPTGVIHGSSAPPPLQQDSVFRHSQHRDVDCLSCHTTEESHGRVTVTTIQDCRSCHHDRPATTDCSTCHAGSDVSESGVYPMIRPLVLSVGDRKERPLPFDHAPHEGLDCAGCHTSGLELSAGDVDCTSCHEEHHDAEVRCMSCHQEAPTDAHPVEQVHVGCSGSGCHTDLPIPGVPRTRNFCLTCHQDLEDHRPGQGCEECHQLPEPRRVGGADG